MKILYFGPFWPGSTALQRLKAFQSVPEHEVIGVDNGSVVKKKSSLYCRIRWKLRLPVDELNENSRLIESVRQHNPWAVIVDNSKVITKKTIAELRKLSVKKIVYYTPDDIIGEHNLSFPLKWSLPLWDLIFTTKTFNVEELQSLNAKPYLIGKSFDAVMHRPMSSAEVGEDFEKFDVVFLGTYEYERCESINRVAQAGYSVVVYGADKGNWSKAKLDSTITLRNSMFGEDYVRAWHSGKLALCFLRKLNRDRITQRTMEIAAIGRPMLAERTDEHDMHFIDGSEYLGFSSDEELISKIEQMLANYTVSNEIGKSARRRCLMSGYSTNHRALQMIEAIKNA